MMPSDSFRNVTLAAGLAAALSGCDQPIERSVEVQTAEEATQEEHSMPDAHDAVFVDGMVEKIFQNYLHVSRALSEDDPGTAAEKSEAITDSFSDERQVMERLAARIAATDDLVYQRTAFAELSEQLEPLFENNLSAGRIHVVRCPMAFDGAGATWIADAPEVRNPYYGAEMLECGEVVKTIEPKKEGE